MRESHAEHVPTSVHRLVIWTFLRLLIVGVDSANTSFVENDIGIGTIDMPFNGGR